MARSNSWKQERASVSRNKKRSSSNKYSRGDTTSRPGSGSRSKVWVAGYDRQDGTHVDGYYRSIG